MINDVLADAVSDIDDLLDKDGLYTGEIRQRILKLRDEMDAMRAELDSPAGGPIYSPSPRSMPKL